ncbi:MAG: DUF2231 domain-containing protein [Actinomycetota bacterium]|nr:DUF2231 domain-containing protein [Actinomycetota bacterium]
MRMFSFRPAIEFRGRKFKGLRGFAGKPFHPPLTDIPVGAYTIGPVLSIAAFLFQDASWADKVWSAAGYTMLVGAVASVATSITGFADWLNTKKGTQIRRMANAHMWTMLVLTGVVLVALAMRFFGDQNDSPDLIVLVLDLVIVTLVTFGGTIGGSMTYDFGFNVETATDNHVYHVSEHDIVHPHDEPPPETKRAMDATQ